MRRALLLVAVAACSGDPRPAAPVPIDARRPDAAPVVIAAPDAAAPAPAPSDPRVVELLAMSPGCTWTWAGDPECDAGHRLSRLAHDHPQDVGIAASCAAALASDRAAERSFAASCLGEVDPTLVALHLATVLHAFEIERVPELRQAIAGAMSNTDAVGAGFEDRVVKLARAHGFLPDGDWPAASLLASLIRAGLPSRPVADLTLELARHGGPRTRFVAFSVLPRLIDRLPEVCALVADLAATPDLLTDVLYIVAQTRDACVDQLDPVIDAMVAAMTAGTYDVAHYLPTRTIVQQTPLKAAQRDRLAAAARPLPTTAPEQLRGYARGLVRALARLR